MTGTTSAPGHETVHFGGLEIGFDERLLRPRTWTAEQSRWAAELLDDAPDGPVLELCAGAGHIGLLAVTLRARPLVCVDVSSAACDYARRNAETAGLGGLVTVREGTIDDVLDARERFALVIADPPWVRRVDTGRFPEDPLLAIDGGDDGLDVARACLRAAGRHLVPGGSLVLQLGTLEQVTIVRDELPAYGAMDLVETRSYPRGVLARFDASGP